MSMKLIVRLAAATAIGVGAIGTAGAHWPVSGAPLVNTPFVSAQKSV